MTICIIVAGFMAVCVALLRHQEKPAMKRVILKDSDFFEEP